MSIPSHAEVVIVGAGIAGVSAAYQLAIRGVPSVVVDCGSPLSMTSDKSTECYRNWWPGPDAAMTQIMNRSIDLLETLAHDTNNAIHLNKRGYLFVTQRQQRVDQWRTAATEACSFGAGSVRESVSDFAPNSPDGVDILSDGHAAYPYLPEGCSTMHVRRAGWLKSDLLGRIWMDRARDAGVAFVRGSLTGINLTDGKVSSAIIKTRTGEDKEVETSAIVNAAGPFSADVARLVGIDLPLHSELHLKLNFRDIVGAMPRGAPLVICDDPIMLSWSDEDRRVLADDPTTQFLVERFPAGIHGRPEGEGNSVLLLWTAHCDPVKPTFPIQSPPFLADIVIRGMAQLIPGFCEYNNGFPPPIIDGGYYTKTPENRPLVGATTIPGFWLCCGLSGYGIMAAAACGELLAESLLGNALPKYASAFRLDRYQQPGYAQRVLAHRDESQL